MFRTKYDPFIDRVPTRAGDRFVKTYHLDFDENNSETLVEDGLFDLYASIQAYKDSVDLSLILAQYKQVGDESILNRRKTFYADVSGLPNNYPDMFRLVRSIEETFSKLPLEEREKYGHNPLAYCVKVSTLRSPVSDDNVSHSVRSAADSPSLEATSGHQGEAVEQGQQQG
jgi:hypothetical protein